MDSSMVVVLIGLGLIALVVWMVLYNTVVGRRNAVDGAFSSIDVMLKKRADLIPNLVASVKQYMLHEASLLERITSLRNTAVRSGVSEHDRLQAEGELSGALGQLRVAVENYPDLKASQNFLQLQGALNESEEQISAARRAFNAAVLDYNNAVDMFPYSVIAGMNNFEKREFFEIPESERQNVDVKSLFS